MADGLDRYRAYGERIEALIRPATYPPAIRPITSGTEMEPEYK